MGLRTFFGDVIGREVWEPIQEQLATALRMEIHTFGPDGQDLCPPSGLTRFRRLLETSADFQETIVPSRLGLMNAAQERADLVVEQTTTGRLRFSVPILFDGGLVATVTGGGVVTLAMSKLHLRELARRFKLDLRVLTQAAAELPVVDHGVVVAAARLIDALLHQIVTAVELRERAEVRARRLAILTEVGHAVTASLDLLRVLETVTAAVPRVIPAKAAVLALVDENDQQLRVRASWGVSDEFIRVRRQLGRGLLGYVVSKGEMVNVPDMLVDPRNAYADLDRQEGHRALLATPLRDGDRVVGVLGAFHGEPHSFTGGDEQILASLADYAASAVRNARLYERVTQAYRELGVSTRRLQEAQERLFQADRLALLGKLAGDTAHEVKNTLGGIIGAAATVRDHLGNMAEDDVRELLAAIAEEGWRLRETIEAVRGYAKPAHFGTGRHSVAETIEDVVRLMRFDREFQHLPFAVECPPQLSYVGDRDRVKQVLVNLVRNAAEAFDGVRGRQPEIRITVTSTAETVRIAVTDNGIGIAPDRIERIWEPFYTTKGEAGTGLGLDTVRQIVRALGGEVEVVSEVDVGTTFTVSLPRAVDVEVESEIGT